MPILPPQHVYDTEAPANAGFIHEAVPAEPTIVLAVLLATVVLMILRQHRAIRDHRWKDALYNGVGELASGHYPLRIAAILIALTLIFPPWVGWSPDGVRYYLGRMVIWEANEFGFYIDFGRLFVQATLIAFVGALADYGLRRVSTSR